MKEGEKRAKIKSSRIFFKRNERERERKREREKKSIVKRKTNPSAQQHVHDPS